MENTNSIGKIKIDYEEPFYSIQFIEDRGLIYLTKDQYQILCDKIIQDYKNKIQ